MKDSERVKLWRKNNPEKDKKQKRRWMLKKRYGLTEQSYQDLFERQNERCAICQRISTRRLDVDHCHATKRIRGLLCNQCNKGIGVFNHDPLIIKSALEYLGGVQ